MTTEAFQKLLAKHLKGETTPSEKKQIEQFEQHFLDKNQHQIFSSNSEKAAVYRELRSRIEPPVSKRFSWLKIAAAVLLFFGASYSAFYITQNTSSIATAYGESITTTLSDGSIVQLNGGSSLKYSAWWGDERKIELSGEAFFKVAKDKAHPFVVYANGTKTTALGTEFNVHAYPEDSVIQVSLVEGSVEVGGFNQVDTLAPNQQASFSWKDKGFNIQAFQTSNVLGWRTKKLLLSKTSFGQLAVLLRRNYGVVLSFEDASFKAYTVSGQLENTDINAFLEAVSATKGLESRKLNESEYLILKAGENE
jgi:transmembrane sensor